MRILMIAFLFLGIAVPVTAADLTAAPVVAGQQPEAPCPNPPCGG